MAIRLLPGTENSVHLTGWLQIEDIHGIPLGDDEGVVIWARLHTWPPGRQQMQGFPLRLAGMQAQVLLAEAARRNGNGTQPKAVVDGRLWTTPDGRMVVKVTYINFLDRVQTGGLRVYVPREKKE